MSLFKVFISVGVGVQKFRKNFFIKFNFLFFRVVSQAIAGKIAEESKQRSSDKKLLSSKILSEAQAQIKSKSNNNNEQSPWSHSLQNAASNKVTLFKSATLLQCVYTKTDQNKQRSEWVKEQWLPISRLGQYVTCHCSWLLSSPDWSSIVFKLVSTFS